MAGEWSEERVAWGERRTSSGRAVRPPNRLQQERVEGVARCTPEQREARLKETLAKSARLTQRLMKRLDQESDESGEEDEGTKEGMLRRRKGRDGREGRDSSDDSSDNERGLKGGGKRK